MAYSNLVDLTHSVTTTPRHQPVYQFSACGLYKVRAAVVFALGTFINNSGERGEHANNIDHGVAAKLLTVLSDGSPVVRKVRLTFLSLPACVHFQYFYYIKLVS